MGGAAAFAAAVAARHAPARPRAPGAGGVLLHAPRGAGALAPARAAAPRLTLLVAPRLVVEDHGRTVLAPARALVQRVERHVVATRHLVERTRRVEQVPVGRGALPHAQLPADPHAAAAPAPAPLVVPALPRVLRHAAAPPPPAADAGRAAAPAPRPVPAAAAPGAVDVARLTDEVMRGIDRRLAAWRERHGRV